MTTEDDGVLEHVIVSCASAESAGRTASAIRAALPRTVCVVRGCTVDVLIHDSDPDQALGAIAGQVAGIDRLD